VPPPAWQGGHLTGDGLSGGCESYIRQYQYIPSLEDCQSLLCLRTHFLPDSVPGLMPLGLTLVLFAPPLPDQGYYMPNGRTGRCRYGNDSLVSSPAL